MVPNPSSDLAVVLGTWRSVLAKLPASLRDDAQHRLDARWASGAPSDAGAAANDMLEAAPAYLRARLRTALARATHQAPPGRQDTARVAEVEGQRINVPYLLSRRDAAVLLQTSVVRVERLPIEAEAATYAVVTGAGARRLVRLSPLAERGASRAAYCLQLLYRDTGLPVPRVVSVDEAGGAVPYAVLILEQPGGVPLTQALAEADEEERLKLLALFGAALAQAHRALLPASGPLDATGLVQAQSWARWHGSLAAGALEAARRTPLAPLCDAAESWLAQRRQWVPERVSARLLHGDPRPGDLLVEAHAVTALLGFESAMAGDPAFDVAQAEGFLSGPWSRAAGARERHREAFLDGYSAEGALPADYDQRRQVYRVVHLLRAAKSLVALSSALPSATLAGAYGVLRAALERAVSGATEPPLP